MRVRYVSWAAALTAGAAALAMGAAGALASPASQLARPAAGQGGGHISHVLLISVDGLHQQDLTWYDQHFPHSALANLTARGVEFSNAMTPIPSDSFPGLIGQVTGGDPGVTGIYYDDTWNHAVFPA